MCRQCVCHQLGSRMQCQHFCNTFVTNTMIYLYMALKYWFNSSRMGVCLQYVSHELNELSRYGSTYLCLQRLCQEHIDSSKHGSHMSLNGLTNRRLPPMCVTNSTIHLDMSITYLCLQHVCHELIQHGSHMSLNGLTNGHLPPMCVTDSTIHLNMSITYLYLQHVCHELIKHGSLMSLNRLTNGRLPPICHELNNSSKHVYYISLPPTCVSRTHSTWLSHVAQWAHEWASTSNVCVTNSASHLNISLRNARWAHKWASTSNMCVTNSINNVNMYTYDDSSTYIYVHLISHSRHLN